MKILIIGSGGREDALYQKLKADGAEVFVAPGSGSSQTNGDAVNIGMLDFEQLAAFARQEAVDLTLVGPELPLCRGLADYFEREGLAVFGPGSEAARLEGSKDFGKQFMSRHGIPTAHSVTCTGFAEAIETLNGFSYPLVIKADGLCAGKGVLICPDEVAARRGLREIFVEQVFGEEGGRVIIEEFMSGPEVSLLCLVSGTRIYALETATDYKKARDNDAGPNTGGMGAVSPSPHWNSVLEEQSERIIGRISRGLEVDGLGYTGVLFIGYMIVDGELRVLEFNVRFGDPETEVVLPRLRSSLPDVLGKVMAHETVNLSWRSDACVGVVVSSGGYPGPYSTGHEISLGDFGGCSLCHNGTRYDDGRFYTNGGRVLTLTAMGPDRQAARNRVYSALPQLSFEGMYYRGDIGS